MGHGRRRSRHKAGLTAAICLTEILAEQLQFEKHSLSNPSRWQRFWRQRAGPSLGTDFFDRQQHATLPVLLCDAGNGNQPRSAGVRTAADDAMSGGDAMEQLPGLTGKFSTILVDPPWRFQNRTGKVAPEHRRLRRYPTMSFSEIAEMPVDAHAADACHLYMWCPNALLPEGLEIMRSWGFQYKTNLVWYKIRKDGAPTVAVSAFIFAM